MSFPISPTNGQTAVVNGTTYTYSLATRSWTRVPVTLNTVNPALYINTVNATTSVTLVDTLPITSNTYVRWTVSAKDNTNSRYASTVIDSINDGTTVYYTQSGTIKSNPSYNVVTFTSNISGGNVNLYAVGDSSSVTVSYQRAVLGSASSTGYLTTGPMGPAWQGGPLSSNLVVTSGSDTVSPTTGAVLINNGGGLSVAGNAYVGNNLYIGPGSFSTTLTTPTIVAVDAGSTYAQLAMKNSSGTGSADFAAYADNGVDGGGWVDMGIAGSTFSDPAYTITKPQDGYLITRPTSSTYGGNLVIGTSDAGFQNDITFSVGSFFANAEVARFRGNTLTNGNLTLKYTTASTSTTTGALIVSGGVGIAGAVYNGGVHVSSGNVVAASGTASTSTTSGALVVVGGAGVSGNVNIGGITTHTGNVTFGPTANVAIDVNGRTDAVALPSGTTAQRPALATAGALRWNTTNGSLDLCVGSGVWAAITVNNGLTSATAFRTLTDMASQSVNGTYWIQTANMTAATQYYVDYTSTNGGPWVRVFLASTTNYNASSYSWDAAQTVNLIPNCKQFMYAFCNSSNNALTYPWAFNFYNQSGSAFSTVTDGNWSSFLNYPPMAHGSAGAPLITLVNTTRLADNTTYTGYLRTGISSFGSNCDDSRSATWGQICLKAGGTGGSGTGSGGYSDFPFYTTFANSGTDNWAASNQGYTTNTCDTAHLFAIYVKLV